jgi:hypothetical protein
MENQYSKFEYSRTENPSVLNGIRDEEKSSTRCLARKVFQRDF